MQDYFDYMDDLDNMSRVSVQTPKTHISKQSEAQSHMSRKLGASVGKASSIRTTTTTKDKLAVLQAELEEEKKKRIEVEQKLIELKNMKK